MSVEAGLVEEFFFRWYSSRGWPAERLADHRDLRRLAGVRSRTRPASGCEGLARSRARNGPVACKPPIAYVIAGQGGPLTFAGRDAQPRAGDPAAWRIRRAGERGQFVAAWGW